MIRRVVPAVLLACLAILSVVPGARTAERPLVPPGLAQQAAASGKVRVLVRVSAPFVPEHFLGSAAQVLGQRQMIASAQTAVTSGLRGVDHKVVRQFDSTLPLLALEASPDALRLLESLRGVVVDVREDRLREPMLFESVPLISGDDAWGSGYDGTGTIVAILDTGVEAAHPFLSANGASKVIAEVCFSSTFTGFSQSVCPGGVSFSTGAGSAAPCALPGCDHGTHVAGIAAGGTPGVAGSGVAPGAKIIAIQVFWNIGGTAQSFDSDQIAAMNYLFNHRNDFPGLKLASANMSLGGGVSDTTCDDEPQKPAIDQLRSVGVATAIAAGNNGLPNMLSVPGCISSAISVGSTTKLDAVSFFSNVAPFLSVFAPGGDATGGAGDIRSSVPGGGFGHKAGTSMATPHVAGAFAVLRQAAPAATVDQLLNALQVSGKPIQGALSTRPRINVMAALQLVGLPDLVVQTLSTPAAALPGVPVNVTVSAKNVGPGSAATTKLRLYLAASSAITTSDTQLAEINVPALGPGAISPAQTVAVTVPPSTAPGAYFLGAIVDPDATTTDSHHGNNTRAVALKVVLPDLLVTALSAPATALAGKPLVISSTVRNAGTAPAGAVRVSFYMAQGDSTPGAGTPVGVRDLAGLAASTNASAMTTLTLAPNMSAGTYFLSARVDTNGAVTESDETNNGFTAPNPVSVSLYRPDVLVTAVSAPANGQTGRPLVITSTVRNGGTAPAGPFRVNFFMSQADGTPGAGRAVGFRSVAGLAAGTNASAPITITIPPDLAAGTYFLSAVADPLANVELTGANNGATATGQVNVALYRPELTIEALKIPAFGRIGRTISVTSAVRNAGPAPATAFKIRFYVSSTSATPGDGTMIGVRSVTSLAVGANVSAATTLTIPDGAGLTEGSYHLSAVADADQQQIEIDETNNGLTAPGQIALTLLRPDLTVSAATAAPALASPGFTVNVSNSVRNAGDVPTAGPVLVRFYLAATPSLAGGEPIIGNRSIAAPLAVNATSSAVTPVVIPHGTAPGTYFVVVRANDDNAIVEYPGANNTKATAAVNVQRPNLQIVSIAPPRAIIRGKAVDSATPRASIVVRNAGAGPAMPFDLQVYARRDDGLPGANTSATGDLVFTRSLPALAPNASTTVSAPVTVSETVDTVVRRAGNYFVSAVADAAARNDEAVPGDNSLTASLKVAVLPDVKKLKTASVAVTLGGCSVAGTTLNLAGSFTAGSQTVNNPSTFTAVMPLQDPALGFSQTYMVTGTVESVDVFGTEGKVKTTFTYTSTGPTGKSMGLGSIDAAVPERSLAGALAGTDKSDETCTFSGTLSIDPQP